MIAIVLLLSLLTILGLGSASIPKSSRSAALFQREDKSSSISIVSHENYQYENAKYAYYSTRNQEKANTGKVNPQQEFLKAVPTYYVGIVFLLLSWRSLGSFEMADNFQSDILRTICVIPSVVLLLANIGGFLLNASKPLNFKNRLKFIIAMNIIREWVEMAYNIVNLIISRTIPREVYFGRIFVNVWWSFLCLSYTKSRWVTAILVEQAAQK